MPAFGLSRKIRVLVTYGVIILLILDLVEVKSAWRCSIDPSGSACVTYFTWDRLIKHSGKGDCNPEDDDRNHLTGLVGSQWPDSISTAKR